MLPKKRRVTGNEITSLFKEGSHLRSGPSFSCRYLKGAHKAKFSIIVPKTVASLAVERNTLRRKWYGALQEVVEHARPGTYVFILKKDALSLKIEDIKKVVSFLASL